MNKAVIIYHGNCPDGFTAAWLMHRYCDKLWDEVELVPGSYGTSPPEIKDSSVFLVDFCYEPEHLERLDKLNYSLTVLDHHQTAHGWLKEFAGVHVYDSWTTEMRQMTSVLLCDQTHSGAMLAALWTDQPVPFVKYIEDRDLWRFDYGDKTAYIFAAVTAREYTLHDWDEIASIGTEQLAQDGKAISAYRDRIIEQAVDKAFQTTILGHEGIWVAPCPYAIGSDVAGILALRDPDRFAAYYMDQPDGVRKWGLRSVEKSGMDVAVLAATRPPGGGHKHAAGFEDVRSEP